MANLQIALLGEEETDDGLDTDKRIEGDIEEDTDDDSSIEDTDDDSSDEDSEDDEEEAVLPEIGEMAVDDIIEEDRVKEDEAQRCVRSASRLQKISEIVTECYKKDGLTKQLLYLAQELHTQEKQLLGINAKRKNVSLESYIAPKYNIVLEGFMDTIKSIIDAIIKFFKDSIEWLKKFFKAVNLDRTASTAKASTVIESIVSNREKIKKNTSKVARDFIAQKYSQKDYISDTMLSSKLKVNYENIRNYSSALSNVLYLINHKAATRQEYVYGIKPMYIEDVVGEDIITVLNKYKDNNFTDFPTKPFNPHVLCHPEVNDNDFKLQEADTHSDKVESRVATEGNIFHIQCKLFGNYHVVHEYNKFFKSDTAQVNVTITAKEMFEFMNNWNISIMRIPPKSGSDNGTLRNIPTEELGHLDVTFKAIYSALSGTSKQIDSITVMKKTIIDALEKIKHTQLTNEDTAVKSDASKISSALMSIRRIADSYMSSKIMFTTGILDAWSKYLDAILQKEMQIANS